jgi:ribosomal protein S18 acetylase RimI-like enzyme
MEMIINNKKISSIIAALVISVMAGVGSYVFWFKADRCNGVVAYQAHRDKAVVKKIFKDNLHWVVNGPNYQNYDVDFMLDNHASAFDPINKRNLIFNVYCAQGRTVGFEAHFIKSFLKGYILFMVVDQAERGKGYAIALLKNAIEQIAKAGCSIVELVTGVDNIPAQKLYEKVGFVETSRDNDVIHYEYRII